jgi:hypothetical protein
MTPEARRIYAHKRMIELQDRENSFSFPSAAAIAAYAATKEFGKEKSKWNKQHTRPFQCFCGLNVHIGTVTSVGTAIERFAYPYIACHYQNPSFDNNRPRKCLFYVNLAEIKQN